MSQTLEELELRFDGPIPAHLKPGYVAPKPLAEVDRLRRDLRTLENQLEHFTMPFDKPRVQRMIDSQKARIAAEEAAAETKQ